MSVQERVGTVFARFPREVDVAVALFLFGFTLLVPHPDNAGQGPQPTAAVTVLVASLSLVLVVRRRWPVAVLAVAVGGTALAYLLADGAAIYTAAIAFAMYAVATRCSTRTTVTTFVGSAVTLVLSTLAQPTAWGLSAAADPVAWIAVPATLGYAVRSHAAYLAAIEDRAVRAERTREEEARRQVAEERLRIARELHDVVAHHVAVVSVQAGMASHLVERDPVQAKQAVQQVQRSSATILDELGGILHLLRQDDEPPADRPAPGLDQLDDLIASYAAAGLRVRFSTSGEARALDDSLDLVAYRVVEESLTNAQKHGAGLAEVDVRYQPGSIVVTVTNAVPVGTPTSLTRGYGLAGMHERARAVGGTLDAGPDGPDQFRVRLVLPTQTAEPRSR